MDSDRESQETPSHQYDFMIMMIIYIMFYKTPKKREIIENELFSAINFGTEDIFEVRP